MTDDQRTHDLGMDLCLNPKIVARVREDTVYAQNLYAALCNTEWQEQDVVEILRDRTWSCSWRTAGAIVADIRGEGDYLDWYCSGMMRGHPDDMGTTADGIDRGYLGEGHVSDLVREDLLAIGWLLVDQ